MGVCMVGMHIGWANELGNGVHSVLFRVWLVSQALLLCNKSDSVFMGVKEQSTPTQLECLWAVFAS